MPIAVIFRAVPPAEAFAAVFAVPFAAAFEDAVMPYNDAGMGANGTCSASFSKSRVKNGGYSVVFDLHPFNRPFTGEAWKAPVVKKSYYDVFPDLHWRVQDIINSNIQAGLNIKEMAELPAADASFWYTYDELKTISQENIRNINDWKFNPMAAIPAWIAVIAQKGN